MVLNVGRVMGLLVLLLVVGCEVNWVIIMCVVGFMYSVWLCMLCVM